MSSVLETAILPTELSWYMVRVTGFEPSIISIKSRVPYLSATRAYWCLRSESNQQTSGFSDQRSDHTYELPRRITAFGESGNSLFRLFIHVSGASFVLSAVLLQDGGGDSGGHRTPDNRIFNPTLYQTELQSHIKSWLDKILPRFYLFLIFTYIL